MYNRDSLDKIEEYLKELDKDTLIVLPSFFKEYNCPPNCGGCCLNFSKDFFEEEFREFKFDYPEEVKKFKKREKNGLTVWSYLQDKNTIWCDFFKDGKCSIHCRNPFSCRFELNKIRPHEDNKDPLTSTNLFKAFYRDKTMKSFEGEPLKCYFKEYTEGGLADDIDLLEELNEIYFKSRGKYCENLSVLVNYLLEINDLDFRELIRRAQKEIVIVKGEIRF